MMELSTSEFEQEGRDFQRAFKLVLAEVARRAIAGESTDAMIEHMAVDLAGRVIQMAQQCTSMGLRRGLLIANEAGHAGDKH